MENLRYLLAAIAALTLIMSVVSSVNPSYFAGLNAFADHDDEDMEDDDNSGSSNDDHEDDEDNDNNNGRDEDEEKIVKDLGNNSKVALEIDEDTELQVEIEDGDLDDGTYDVVFACDSPDVDEEFADALDVEDGEGEFEEDLSLTNGTYNGCEVEVGDLAAAFSSFTIVANEDEDEEDDDDDNNNGRDEDEEEIVKDLGNNSEVALEIDDDAELKIEIEDGDLDDGTYDVVFACTSPDVDEEFTDALVVEDGEGEFEEDLPLSNGTYTGCEVEVGDLSAVFSSFTIAANDDDEEDDEEDDDNNNHEDDDHGQSRGSDDDDEDDHSNSGKGSDDDEEEDDDNDGDDKRKERKHRIVNSTSGAEIHKRHRGDNAASSGDYRPGWNYTLEAEGEAMHTAHDENLAHEANVTASVDMSVWKSNSAIILFDIVGGTVEVEGQDYDVRIGYAIYFVEHDAMKVAALATNDDGDVFRLKLRGSAVDGSDQFPMQTGSIDMLFGGDVNDRFEDWNLLLEGTIEAN